MDKNAIIVAGGEGTRLGGALPKQFRDVADRPMLWWSMKAFHDEDPATRIILVLNPRCFELWRDLFLTIPKDERFDLTLVAGGASRTQSVAAGLAEVEDTPDSLVAVHDAARPLVSTAMISRGWQAAALGGGAVPVTPVTDSLRLLEKDGGSRAVDRSGYVAVQTPQVFRTHLLKEAYAANPDAVYSDDATAFEAYGKEPVLFEGSPDNMKVTNPGDIEIAAMLMKRRRGCTENHMG